MTPTEEIKNQIFGIFDLLRTERLSAENYFVILFFLQLYKGTEFDSKLNDPFDQLEEYIYRYDPYEITFFKESYQVFFKLIVNNISFAGLKSVFEYLSRIDRQIVLDNFPDIFESVLFKITQAQNRYGGEFIQPIELTRFICSIADLPEKSSIFNPFAGLASFGLCNCQEHNYSGQEINQKTWAIGTLRLLAHKRQGTSDYVCDDSILHWPVESEKFDLVVANPPYGIRISQKYRVIEPGIRTIEQFLIEKGVNSLNKKGKLIALLPQGFLFRGMQEHRLRQYLIEEDLIDSVISLPGGLLLNTGIPLVILVLNKNKKTPGKVRFVDASKFVESKNRREKILNDHGLIQEIRGIYKDSEVIRMIDNSQIREFDYNLNVPRYFQKQKCQNLLSVY